MEITKKERQKLLKKRNAIRKLTLRILEMAHDPKNLEEIKKNIMATLSQLSEITSCLYPTHKSFPIFQSWAVSRADYIFRSISFAVINEKTVDPLLWKAIVPDLTAFAKVVNSVSFDFTETGLKIILPALSSKTTVALSEGSLGKGDDKGTEWGSELSIPEKVRKRVPKEVQVTLEGVRLCYQHGHADFCFMGLRKALSTAIHIRFKQAGKEAELYDINDEPYSLTKWIELAKQNGFLSATVAKQLAKELKFIGDISAHDYRVDFQREDVPSVFRLLRVALDRMYSEKEKAQNEALTKPAVKPQPTIRPASLGREFDLIRFQANLAALNGVSDSETRYELLEKMRHQTTDLPYDGLSYDVRKAVVDLLQILEKERENGKIRRLCLDILRIINGRRDEKMTDRIKSDFLPWIEKNYRDFTVEEKQYAIDIIQMLNKYNPEFMKKIMLDSINNWSSEEFDKLYKEIEFNRLEDQRLQEMKVYLWKILDEARKNKLEERKIRIEKLLMLSFFA